MKNRHEDSLYEKISDWTYEALINCILVVISLSASITILAIPAFIWTLELIGIWKYYKNTDIRINNYEFTVIFLCVLTLMTLMCGLTADTFKAMAKVLIAIGITIIMTAIEFNNYINYELNKFSIIITIMLIFGSCLVYIGIRMIKTERKI